MLGIKLLSIENFFKIFLSADGGSDFPHSNILGNHLGIWDFSFEKKSRIKYYLKLSAFFEDLY